MFRISSRIIPQLTVVPKRKIAAPFAASSFGSFFHSSKYTLQEKPQQSPSQSQPQRQQQQQQQSQQKKENEVEVVQKSQQNQPSRRSREKGLSTRSSNLMTDLDPFFSLPTLWDARNPFSVADNIRKRVFKEFDDVVGRDLSSSLEFPVSDWNPRADVIVNKDGSFTIQAEIPGVSKENIKVEVDSESVLTLQGDKKSEHEEGKQGGDFWRQERTYGTFVRRFSLPTGVDPKKLRALLKMGC